MNTGNVAVIDQQNPMQTVPEPSTSTANMLMNNQVMTQLQQFAKLMSSGRCTVPKHLQGQEGDCMAIAMQSAQWGMNPFAVAQKTHLVNGTLGYEAQLVNAVISSSNVIQGRFQYEYGGDWSKPNSPDAWVKCGAILKGDSEITWIEPIYIANIQVKNSPLWKSNPKQQGAYLAVKYWGRLYTPEVILGVYTPDEVETRTEPPKERDVTPQPDGSSTSSKAKKLVSKLGAKKANEPQAIESESSATAVDHTATIQTLIDGIGMCATLKDLEVCGEDIASVGESMPKEAMNPVRKAYGARKRELEAAQANADPHTGELLD